MEGYLQLQITRLAYLSKEAKGALLTLQEVDGERHFSLMIGMEEATSIAAILRNIPLPITLTHDLMHQIMLNCHITIQKVLIHAMEQGIFQTNLHFLHNDQSFSLSARTSDAIAMALRFEKPIYISSTLFDNIISQQQTSVQAPLSDSMIDAHTDLSNYTDHQLATLLSSCLDKEEYEKAIFLRDELNRRKSDINLA